ncbi:TetR/AcrR family transcriptional regulator [Actinomycetospora lutea]|uniref:TetR/AcrR family transcriptional regulator n=1 Tax=Actinomycetospora lutea TaxID=663604 RepID=UPI0023664E96|nr:TetR/AcrR family transcriptional regulator [Actinomycetospora lutea]MDD7940558.1 TetR/AcrR family transcriptional regulator [Actinomycetospora lutea]
MTTRMSRAAQTERNRGRVLDAARRVFLAAGYHGARLDAIAEEAGFSKGVVYSQFAGKADLFLALLDQRIVERAEANAELAADHAGVEGLHALLVANTRREQEDAWAQLLIEFRVAAARDPELNARYAALHERTLEHFGETVRRVLERGGLVPVYPPRVFAGLILALGTGRVLEDAAGTARFDVEIVVDLLRRLVEPAPSSREAS